MKEGTTFKGSAEAWTTCKSLAESRRVSAHKCPELGLSQSYRARSPQTDTWRFLLTDIRRQKHKA